MLFGLQKHQPHWAILGENAPLCEEVVSLTLGHGTQVIGQKGGGLIIIGQAQIEKNKSI